MNCNTIRTAYFQSAEGSVTLPYRPGFPHCGPENNPLGGSVTITYRIYLEFPEDSLDEKGFLLDNLSFRDFFEACRYRFREGLEHSCENFARYCCGMFCEMSKCWRAKVAISAIDGVWIGHIMESAKYCTAPKSNPLDSQVANYMAHRDFDSYGKEPR